MSRDHTEGSAAPRAVRFGPFRLDRVEKLLFRDDEVVPLTPKAFEMLDLLVRNAGRVVEKDALLRGVWPDTFVDEANLSHHVFALRKALGDDREGTQYIATMPRRGYRFVAAVQDEIESEPFVEQAGESAVAGERPQQRRTSRGAMLLVIVFTVAVAAIAVWASMRRTAPSRTPIRTLAILPFTALRVGASTDGQLGLGLADALITRLSNLDDVVVRPTAAVAKFERRTTDLASIGEQLGVDALLDGGVQRSGNRLRLTVQLVRVIDQRSLWAQTFDEPFTDVFALEDTISQKVASAVSSRLTAMHREQLNKRYTSDSRAYERYLEGRYLWSRSTADSLDASIARFGEAVAIDPNFALAYAGIAESQNSLATWGFRASQIAYPHAEAAAARALALDPMLAAAHTAMGRVQYRYRWNYRTAEQHLRRAVELNPRDFGAHLSNAEYLIVMGRFSEADGELRRAGQIDPASLQVRMQRAIRFYFSRDYATSVREAEAILKLDGQFAPAYGILWAAARQLGKNEQAMKARLTDLRMTGYPDDALEQLRRAFAAKGIVGFEKAEIAMLESFPNANYDVTIFVAMNYVIVGDRAAALRWLQRAYAQQSGWLPELSVDPVWDPLRADSQFVALVSRVSTAGEAE